MSGKAAQSSCKSELNSQTPPPPPPEATLVASIHYPALARWSSIVLLQIWRCRPRRCKPGPPLCTGRPGAPACHTRPWAILISGTSTLKTECSSPRLQQDHPWHVPEAAAAAANGAACTVEQRRAQSSSLAWPSTACWLRRCTQPPHLTWLSLWRQIRQCGSTWKPWGQSHCHLPSQQLPKTSST